MVQLASEAVAPKRAIKLIVLDRDGVVNRDSDQFIKTPDEWRPIPGSLEAIARLNHAGYRVVVATNQSGIGRGLFEMATLNAIHEKMYKALALVGGRIDAHFVERDYTGALMALATSRPVVDRFFDDVLVMAEDAGVRANRLALLRGVAEAMNRVADISKLAG